MHSRRISENQQFSCIFGLQFLHSKFCTISSKLLLTFWFVFSFQVMFCSTNLTEGSTNSQTMSCQIVRNTKHNLLFNRIEYCLFLVRNWEGGGGWGDALFFRHDAFLTILGHYRYMYSLTGQILKQLFPSVLVPSDCHLGFFKNFIFNKNAANFLEISRKHVFTASNMNLIKNINYK